MSAGLRPGSSFARSMSSARNARSSSRRRRGSAMSEAGPAIFLLFVFGIFPVVDLIYFGVSYYSVVTLNDLQLREASKMAKSEAISPKGPVIQTVPFNWMNSALGGLAKLSGPPSTEVSYSVGEANVYVTVNTAVSIEPLLKIPFFTKIPGLGEPLLVRIGRTKVLENPHDVLR